MLWSLAESGFENRNKNKISDAFYIKYKKDFSFPNCLPPVTFIKDCRGIIFKKKTLQIGLLNSIKRIEQLAECVLHSKRGRVLKRIENSSLCIYDF